MNAVMAQIIREFSRGSSRRGWPLKVWLDHQTAIGELMWVFTSFQDSESTEKMGLLNCIDFVEFERGRQNAQLAGPEDMHRLVTNRSTSRAEFDKAKMISRWLKPVADGLSALARHHAGCIGSSEESDGWLRRLHHLSFDPIEAFQPDDLRKSSRLNMRVVQSGANCGCSKCAPSYLFRTRSANVRRRPSTLSGFLIASFALSPEFRKSEVSVL